MIINESNPEFTLRVLSVVKYNSHITQRDVTKNMGNPLRLSMAYLMCGIKSGLIKVQQIPENPYACYLTLREFSKKKQLAIDYFLRGFQYFRLARIKPLEIFDICRRKNWHNLALRALASI